MKILGKEVEPILKNATDRRWVVGAGIFVASVEEATSKGHCKWDLSLSGGLMMIDFGVVWSSDPEEAVKEINQAAKRILDEHDVIRGLS